MSAATNYQSMMNVLDNWLQQGVASFDPAGQAGLQSDSLQVSLLRNARVNSEQALRDAAVRDIYISAQLKSPIKGFINDEFQDSLCMAAPQTGFFESRGATGDGWWGKQKNGSWKVRPEVKHYIFSIVESSSSGALPGVFGWIYGLRELHRF